jgi:membrane-associated phospholipid phosphatase
MSMTELFKQNRVFFLGYIFLALIAVFLLLFFSKAEGFVFMNPFHANFLNLFFIGVTFLGDGIFVILLAVILFFFKKKFVSLMILSSYFLSGIIAQVLKYFITEARPAYFLEKTNYPYFIEGVTLHNYHSFPSGHTASAFALAAILSFFIKDKNYALLFLFIAFLVGYSRIYLGQHFLQDVLAGSVAGVFSSVVCWICFEKFFNKILKINKNEIANIQTQQNI